MNFPLPRFGCSLIVALLVSSEFLSLPAHAANITWGAPQNITGDNNVRTDGSLIDAYAFGDLGVTATTINGVTFQPFGVAGASTTASSGNVALAAQGFFSSTNGGDTSTKPPFKTLSNAYQELLGASISGNFTMTISGLIIGAQYVFQWWVNASVPTFPGVKVDHSATAGNSVTLTENTTAQDGGLGQFAVGMFTADANSEVITFSAPRLGQINGFELRQVPENSSTFALLLVSVSALVCLRPGRLRAVRADS